MIPYKQLSLADIFQDCQNKFDHDKPAFLSLLETHIDIDEMILVCFRNHFYTSTGRTRKYPLQAFLWALIILGFYCEKHHSSSEAIFSSSELENMTETSFVPCEILKDTSIPAAYPAL